MKVLEQGPVLILTFSAQQLMIVRNAKGEIVEGGEVSPTDTEHGRREGRGRGGGGEREGRGRGGRGDRREWEGMEGDGSGWEGTGGEGEGTGEACMLRVQWSVEVACLLVNIVVMLCGSP